MRRFWEFWAALPYAYPQRAAIKIGHEIERLLARVSRTGSNGWLKRVWLDGVATDQIDPPTAWYFGQGLKPEQIGTWARQKFVQESEKTFDIAHHIFQNRFWIADLDGKPVFADLGERLDWDQPLHPSSLHGEYVRHIISRQEFTVDLVWAYGLSGDSKYLDKALDLFEDWAHSHILRPDADWANALLVAKRISNWFWMFPALSEAGIDGLRVRPLIKSVLEGAGYLSKHLSYHAPNNHLVTESKALVFAAILFPDHPSADSWREAGTKEFVDCILLQTSPDGVNREQSMGYHLVVCREALEYLLVLIANGQRVEPELIECIWKMVLYAAECQFSGAGLLNYGDSERSQCLRDYSQISSLTLAIFGEELPQASNLSPEFALLWYSGGMDSARPLETEIDPSPLNSWKVFDEGGHSLYRGENFFVHFKHSEFGLNIPKVHGHADALSIEAGSRNQNWIIDPGAYSYENDAWRDYFRGTASHSTVLVDGLDQTPLLGTFSTGRRASARLINAHAGSRLSFSFASHDGYRRIQVIHRRAVVASGGRYFVVIDTFEGCGIHHFEQQWSLPWQAEASMQGINDVAISFDGHQTFRMIFATQDSSTIRIAKGQLDPPLGWENIGQREIRASPSIGWAQQGLPAEITYLSIFLPMDVDFSSEWDAMNRFVGRVEYENSMDLILWQPEPAQTISEELLKVRPSGSNQLSFSGVFLLTSFNDQNELIEAVSMGLQSYKLAGLEQEPIQIDREPER